MSITTVFDPPLPTDSREVFSNKAFTLAAALNAWSTQANATATTVNADASEAADAAASAGASAGAAAGAAGAASTAATAAVEAAGAATSAFDDFDTRYLGAKTADPVLDNNGGALQVGALYFNTVVKAMRSWDGAAWGAAYISPGNVVSKTGDTMAGALNDAPPAVVASAAATDIGGQASNNITITGTATITSFSAYPAGATRLVTFTDALVLTHHADNLILPGGANITTAAGDVAVFQSLGSGHWRCAAYQRASGAPVIAGDLPVVLVGASQSAVVGKHYVITAGGVVLTMPAPGLAKDRPIKVTNASNTTSSSVDFGAGKLRQQSPGVMVLNSLAASFAVQDSGNATYGWV